MNQVITNPEHERLFKQWIQDFPSLDLQEKRLKHYNIQRKVDLQPVGHIYSAFVVSRGTPYFLRNQKYHESTYFQEMKRTITYSKFGKELYTIKDTVRLYQVIIDCPESSDFPLICPNCGGETMASIVEREGCPYCKTHYLMSELFPKVTNFFCIQTGAISTWHKDRYILLAIVILKNGISILFGNSISLFNDVILFSILVLFIYLIVHAIRYERKTIQLMNACSGTKKEISNTLIQYDPSFTYEYFESKALSLARDYVYNSCSDIMDLEYRGGFRLVHSYLSGSNMHLVLDLYVITTIFENEIFQQNETIRMEIVHDIDFAVQSTFHAQRVQCPSCAASFDALTESHCPYCGREYKIEEKDWKIVSISREKK